jgi:hypothetical protein
VKRTLIAILAAFGLAAPGLPLEIPLVPGSEQFNLTIKILTFDRALAGRVGDDLVFGILYEEGDPVSLRVKAEMEKAIASKPDIRIGKIPVRATAIALDRSDRWEETLKNAGVDVASLAPMRNVVLVRIIRLCRDMKLTTVGSLPDYPSLGTTIGFEPGANRPHILINLKAARETGSDFNSRLLAMAKVFR